MATCTSTVGQAVHACWCKVSSRRSSFLSRLFCGASLQAAAGLSLQHYVHANTRLSLCEHQGLLAVRSDSPVSISVEDAPCTEIPDAEEVQMPQTSFQACQRSSL